MYEFRDRVDAGRQLGQKLAELRGQNVVVPGLPRGGVSVAFEVAKALDAPLDVIVVRKLGVPFRPEVAMGAIGEGKARVFDARVISLSCVTEDDLRTVERGERDLLESRVARYRQGRVRADLTDRTAIIVDDGIATGSTARVACKVARQLGAARVILAVPVAPIGVLAALTEPDDVVCLISARNFHAGDEEVVQLLDAAARRLHRVRIIDAGEVEIPSGAMVLRGSLNLPVRCEGIVVFAHGSGSSRHSPRNRFVASVLQRAGLGTLLLDLLTPAEEVDRENVFDIALLARRLMAGARWLGKKDETSSSRVGYFGASAGAGAALWAAAEAYARIAAIVSRGGRPDLAGPRLAAVRAPTPLIVCSADRQVLTLNRQAMALMRAPTRLEIIPGATHLVEEPGTLTQAAAFAAEWFIRYLLPAGNAQPAEEIPL